MKTLAVGTNRELAKVQAMRKNVASVPKSRPRKNGKKGNEEKEPGKKGKKGKRKTVDQQIADMVNAYLKLTDEQRGNWKIVKNITDSARSHFEHRSGPDGRIYLGEVVTLSPEASVKVKTFRVKDKDGSRLGYNRATKAPKLKSILGCLLTQSSSPHHLSGSKASAVYTFAPPFLARIFHPETGEWELYDLDGQHRRHSHILAGAPIKVFIVDMDIDTARYNFILHNILQTKVDRKTVILGSSNPPATAIRALSLSYGASISQVDRLICGLKSGGTVTGVNFKDKNASLPTGVVRRARIILRVWTQDKKWRDQESIPKKEKRTSHHLYSGSGVLQAIGWVVKDRPNMDDDELGARLTCLRDSSNLWYPSSKLNEVYGSSQGDVSNVYDILDKRWKTFAYRPKPKSK
jgi:hypothetical protein